MKFYDDKFKLGRDFIYKNNRILLTQIGKSKVTRPKKITGTRFGAIFGNNEYKTPFQLWCEILGMYKEEPNLYFLEAGRIVEDKLKSHAEHQTGIKWKSYDPEKIEYDLFKDDPIFGGIPDGEEFDNNNQVKSILEIKTAQLDKYKWKFRDNQFVLDLDHRGKPILQTHGMGLLKWFINGRLTIPKSYQDQLSLYMYLRNVDRGYFCVGFLKQEDYENPHGVKFISDFNAHISENSSSPIPRTGHILIFQQHNFNREEFAKRVQMAKEWYKYHIIGGISPVMSSEDLKWFRWGYPDL